jgi:hypothetical protein
MQKLASWSLTASLLLVATSCAGTAPFFRTDGPIQAEGVTVTLTGQRCDFDNPTDPESGSLGGFLDLGIDIQVTNGSQQPVTFDPTAVRLTLGDDTESPSEAGPARTLAPGATEIVKVRFERKGAWSCEKPMTLALNRVVQIGARPVELKRVSFVARG